MKTAIILVSEAGANIARNIQRELEGSEIYSTTGTKGTLWINSITGFINDDGHTFDSFIFIGALGICVRAIAPIIKSKYRDPAVVNVDSTGAFAISVLSGHVGGANQLTKLVASTIGAQPVITTQSDNTNLWALDTLGKEFGWQEQQEGSSMNKIIFAFVNGKRTALLLEVKDKGTRYLERTLPPHVTVYYHWEDIPQEEYEVLIAVTPYIHKPVIPTLYFRPPVLHLGVGCRKDCDAQGVGEYIENKIEESGYSPLSVGSINTIDLKKDEPLFHSLQSVFKAATTHIYTSTDLEDIEVPNPSEKVQEVTGSQSVAEATAIKSAWYGPLVLEKQKGMITEGNQFTFALAMNFAALRKGHIEIVGAGPGDPELISIRGRRMLEEADLILYAGSLVPRELTYCAKEGAVVRSSASMNLEEQFEIMKEFYDKGLFVVRLHTGDPCIYGAIQEQMNFFDQYSMSYHITPGISSFQAAAAALQSQFTIPEKVQTIILTRGEGRTPMPEKEKLHLLARSQSTMCIFLSASVVDDVQEQLLQHYPPATPVAACYKLTWKDEKIYRGELKDLAKIIKENNLTLTTMIVVGDAIDNRQGLSRLYADEFKHLFRSPKVGRPGFNADSKIKD
ncbi:precorrin-4 C(11)-methyltransferase [Bacteroides sp. 51]|uniref:precorrin-4 C(11)-methyltransferase n=1 Tax=Bacteroides sp. 51 TaxID=2302938 RepID=UPI0013D22AA5|nr:precorrin-4 C(11)-methyltransferase [Bacteroides sp. 51]NDV82003.1 precorrin-4 C(11)-methyltransferase [Bacteroides sp. 51]